MAINDLGTIYDANGNDITDQVHAEFENAPEPQTQGWRKKLQEDAEKGKEAQTREADAIARADAAERKVALIEAGVDMSTPLGKYFADTYKGDATVDAIKDAAGQIGLISAAQSPVVQNELAGLERITNASQGAGTSAASSPEEQIENFKGTPEEFDLFVATLGSKIDRNKDVEWQKPQEQSVIPLR